MGSPKSGPSAAWFDKLLAHGHAQMGKWLRYTTTGLDKSMKLYMHSPKSLDPICGKFDKFLAHGQAHMVQMGKWANDHDSAQLQA